ncbi:uncharacterized protein LOC110464348 [Mizuhopecten yessoensis]|uniref:uncharacterized protein LOC110464348 n=1 Tax=Mizuhopecten yessoensis TaxID=6573 RepID=UPI000B45743D|nr:uncharacterized protein LOC110464348 [Mizuhopecten yessoensis]
MSRKNDRSKKNETAEKVKEIQMRQKNWFKQREEHLERKGSSPQIKDLPDNKTSKKLDYNVSTKSKSGLGKFDLQDEPRSVEKTKAANIGKVQPKGKFKHWLEARESQKGKEDDQWNKDRDSVNILRVSSSRSPEFASPESDHFDDHRTAGGSYREEPYRTLSERTGRDAMNTLMSHQDFDALADSIVARVRQGVNTDSRSGLETQQLWSQDVPSKSHARSSEVGRGQKGHTDSKTRDRKGQKEVDTSSHHCPCCHRLMLPPSNVPLINIPCGHSVCETCCQGTELCPSCHCHVTSKTCNLMLLQIIQGYHNNASRRKEVNRETKSYSPENYNEKHSSSSQSYREQHENLIARQDVLLAEADSIKSTMDTLSNQIHRQQRQVHSIAQEETKLRKQMKELEDKLQQLTSHREGYSKEQDQLQHKYNTEANRLNLIKETLLSLEIEVEKVQLLAEVR